MATPSFVTPCTANRNIARDIYEVRMEKPEGLAFQPGQFVLFDVPLAGNPADIQPRAFSIASSPDERDLLFVFKLTPGGRASRWVSETLKPGDTVSFKGPMGRFLLHDEDLERLFLCTSTGNAPFRSQIRHALLSGNDQRTDLIYGVRSEEDLFWEEDFRSLAGQYAHFDLHLALSQPSDAWRGHRGRVQTLAPQIVNDFSRKSVYICGSPDMTAELKKLCLEEWGVPKERLHVEGYI